MKITIVGAGNIGKLFGALLAEAGQDVTLVDIQIGLVKAIENDGITIETSEGAVKTARPKITSDIKTIGPSDLVIIAVKGYATRSAMQNAMAVVGQGSYVMSVQNGAGNVEIISEILRDETRVIGGIFLCVITTLKLNHILWVTGTGGLKFGPVKGRINPMIQSVANLFTQIGINTTLSDNVQDLIWSKLLLNSPLSLATVLGISNDEFLKYPSTRQMVRLIAEEAIAVARAIGIDLPNAQDPIDPLLKTLEEFKKSGKKPKCSMLQDMEAGRRTEIDTITGSIVREGRKQGVQTPVNEALMLLVKAMEEKSLGIEEKR